MRKSEALENGTTELRENIDQFSREFAEMIQKCIDYLNEYRTWWLQHLQATKEELSATIEAAVQEASHCLDNGIEPISVLAQAVFNYSITTPDLQTSSQR